MLVGLHILFTAEFTVTVHNTAFGLSTRSATSVGRVTVSVHGLRHQKYKGAVHFVFLRLLEDQVIHVPKG